MNPQQLKSKLGSLKVSKASFDTDETGEPVNSFFRPISLDGSQIVLKFSGTLNSAPKLYETNFGKHFSMAVKVDANTVNTFGALTVKLWEGCPEDEDWTSKPIANEKSVIIVKLATKDMDFVSDITGSLVSPLNLDAGLEVGSKVCVSAGLGSWYMRNKVNKYGVSLSAKSIHFGEPVAVSRKRKIEPEVNDDEPVR